LGVTLEHLIGKLDTIPTTKVREFEAVLADVAELHDPACIRALVRFFDDDAPYLELMWSIIHLIEMFDDPTYVRELLPALSELHSGAPGYARRVLARLLKSDSCLRELVRQLHEQPAGTKEVVRQIAEGIGQESGDLVSKVEEVKAATT
jgi:hypothetical protein